MPDLHIANLYLKEDLYNSATIFNISTQKPTIRLSTCLKIGKIEAGTNGGTLNSNLSKSATYNYYNHKMDLTFRWLREKMHFNAGVSFQPQHSTLTYSQGNYQVDTTRNVFNFTPTLDFSYNFSKTSRLRIRYRGRSSQTQYELIYFQLQIILILLTLQLEILGLSLHLPTNYVWSIIFSNLKLNGVCSLSSISEMY